MTQSVDEKLTAVAALSVEPPFLVIRPTRGWAALNLRELWTQREIAYFFVWRELKIRYRQAIIGAGWTVLQPLLTMAIFSIFFGRLAGIPSDGIPYPLFALCGLVGWQLFSNSVVSNSTSLVENERLITKVYFPRMLLLIGNLLARLVDFAVALLLLVTIMVVSGKVPALSVFALPFFCLIVVASALGAGFWLSALDLLFRDVRYTVPFLTQIWLFATPVAYPSSLLPEPWHTLFGLNPMAGAIEGIRWAFFGEPTPGLMLWISVIAAVVLLVSGAFFFRRVERRFADII